MALLRASTVTFLLLGVVAVTSCDDGEEGTYVEPTGGAGGAAGTGGAAGGGGTAGQAGDASADAPSDAFDAGDADAEPCLLCAPSLSGKNPFSLCNDNGPPTSQQKAFFWISCACASPCKAVECNDLCTNFSRPKGDCLSCIPKYCQAQVDMCLNDDGTPLPEGGTDGGDAGDADSAADGPADAALE